MQPKKMAQFDNYFGQKVEYGFLSNDSFLKLHKGDKKIGKGTILYSKKHKYELTLGEEIGDGGEGTVYSIEGNSNFVVKIYDDSNRKKSKAEKMKLMIGYENENSNVCWPCDIVNTASGVFVGFIMSRVNGNPLVYLTISAGAMKKKHPKVNRKCQIDIILELLQLFKYLHRHNILFGDINLQNIMFDSQYHVTLVDMDCVQVGQFPCVTTSEGYDSPEVIIRRGDSRFDKDAEGNYKFIEYYGDFYRTLDMEKFALSVLIYKLLMHDSHPYDYEDFDGYDSDNTYNNNELCMNRKFPYSTKMADTVQNARYKEIWSHFPSFLKEAFVNTFAGSRRYSDDEWISIFTKYKRLLESGELRKKDPNCMNPFPEEEINYDTLQFITGKTVLNRSFSMLSVVDGAVKAFETPYLEDLLKKHLRNIAKILAKKPDCTVYITDKSSVYIDRQPHNSEVTVEKYKFKLIYNIGILKKIECESVL